MKIKKIKQSIGSKTMGILDVLTSSSTSDALSANQGRVLNNKIKVLWTNSNPVAVGTFTATLNSSDYDYLIVLCYRNINANLNQTISSQMCEKNKYGEILYNDISGSVRTWNRKFKITNATTVTFETCYLNGEESTFTAVPYKIIGYKY